MGLSSGSCCFTSLAPPALVLAILLWPAGASGHEEAQSQGTSVAVMAEPSTVTQNELEGIKMRLRELALSGPEPPRPPALVLSNRWQSPPPNDVEKYVGFGDFGEFGETRIVITPELVERAESCLLNCFRPRSLTQTVPEYATLKLSPDDACKKNYEIALGYRKLAEDLLKLVESLQAK